MENWRKFSEGEEHQEPEQLDESLAAIVAFLKTAGPWLVTLWQNADKIYEWSEKVSKIEQVPEPVRDFAAKLASSAGKAKQLQDKGIKRPEDLADPKVLDSFRSSEDELFSGVRSALAQANADAKK